MSKKILIMLAIIILLLALLAGYSFLDERNLFPTSAPNQSSTSSGSAPANSIPSNQPAAGGSSALSTPPLSAGTPSAAGNAADTILVSPLSAALSRVTKKPFGIKVSPSDSPVQPERFSGYHTGVDFEILPGEEDKDVPVSAVCSGTVVSENYVDGYGGVLIEACQLEGQAVTVLYGHLRLASVTSRAGNRLSAGERIALLGKGYSPQTDGERKHLHLGIHRGTAIDLRGYVQTQAELSGWLDATKFMAA